MCLKGYSRSYSLWCCTCLSGVEFPTPAASTLEAGPTPSKSILKCCKTNLCRWCVERYPGTRCLRWIPHCSSAWLCVDARRSLPFWSFETTGSGRLRSKQRRAFPCRFVFLLFPSLVISATGRHRSPWNIQFDLEQSHYGQITESCLTRGRGLRCCGKLERTNYCADLTQSNDSERELKSFLAQCQRIKNRFESFSPLTR